MVLLMLGTGPCKKLDLSPSHYFYMLYVYFKKMLIVVCLLFFFVVSLVGGLVGFLGFVLICFVLFF